MSSVPGTIQRLDDPEFVDGPACVTVGAPARPGHRPAVCTEKLERVVVVCGNVLVDLRDLPGPGPLEDVPEEATPDPLTPERRRDPADESGHIGRVLPGRFEVGPAPESAVDVGHDGESPPVVPEPVDRFSGREFVRERPDPGMGPFPGDGADQ